MDCQNIVPKPEQECSFQNIDAKITTDNECGDSKVWQCKVTKESKSMNLAYTLTKSITDANFNNGDSPPSCGDGPFILHSQNVFPIEVTIGKLCSLRWGEGATARPGSYSSEPQDDGRNMYGQLQLSWKPAVTGYCYYTGQQWKLKSYSSSGMLALTWFACDVPKSYQWVDTQP